MNREDLPVSKLAGLCAGLPEESRVKMKVSGQKLTLEQFLIASCLDALRAIIWQNGGGKGKKPESIVEILMKPREEEKTLAFDDAEAFEAVYRAIHAKGKEDAV